MIPKSSTFEYMFALVLATAVLVGATLLMTISTSPNVSHAATSHTDSIYRPALWKVF